MREEATDEALRAFLFGEEGEVYSEYGLLFLFVAITAALALPDLRRRILEAYRAWAPWWWKAG
jgi:Flp pilus assembly pilin Flp